MDNILFYRWIVLIVNVLDYIIIKIIITVLLIRNIIKSILNYKMNNDVVCCVLNYDDDGNDDASFSTLGF